MAAILSHDSISQDAYPSFPEAGPWFNIKMQSYQYRKSHCGDNTVMIRSSYLPDDISYIDKMASLYWISPKVAMHMK